MESNKGTKWSFLLQFTPHTHASTWSDLNELVKYAPVSYDIWAVSSVVSILVYDSGMESGDERKGEKHLFFLLSYMQTSCHYFRLLYVKFKHWAFCPFTFLWTKEKKDFSISSCRALSVSFGHFVTSGRCGQSVHLQECTACCLLTCGLSISYLL